MNIEEARRQIDAFMRWKAQKIKELSKEDYGIPFYTEMDAEVIKKMPPMYITRIHERFLYYAKSSKNVRDWQHCPFCIIYFCMMCPYGKRHGQCYYCGSDYRRFKEMLHANSITDAIGREKIKAKIIELFERGGIEDERRGN